MTGEKSKEVLRERGCEGRVHFFVDQRGLSLAHYWKIMMIIGGVNNTDFQLYFYIFFLSNSNILTARCIVKVESIWKFNSLRNIKVFKFTFRFLFWYRTTFKTHEQSQRTLFLKFSGEAWPRITLEARICSVTSLDHTLPEKKTANAIIKNGAKLW